MKIKAFNSAPAEKTITLNLIQEHDDVLLVACDATTGNRVAGGNILKLNHDGIITRCGAVSPEIGFKLDNCGRVVISNP